MRFFLKLALAGTLVIASGTTTPRNATALELVWSSGGNDLPTASVAGTCTLWVRATLPGESIDPSNTRLAWASLSLGRGLTLVPEAVSGSSFQVCGLADSTGSLEVLARVQTVELCTASSGNLLLALVFEREAGLRARIRLWAPGKPVAEATVGGGGGLVPPPILVRAQVSSSDGVQGVRIEGDFADAGVEGELIDATGAVLTRGPVERTGRTNGWFAAELPERLGGHVVRVIHSDGAFALATLESPGTDRTAPQATNSLVVRLRPGEVVSAPPSGEAPPEQFSFASPGLASTLAENGVTHLSPLFPDFTSIYSANLIGEPIVLEDLSTIYLATLGQGVGDSTACMNLMGTLGLYYVHLNRSGDASAAIPNDPMFGLQWGLRNTGQTLCGEQALAGLDLDLVDAWDITFGAVSETIAVLEDGVDTSHVEFGFGNVLLEPNVATSNVEHHGTTVVGVLSGDTNNGLGISGVAPGCTPHIRGVAGGVSPSGLSQAMAWSRDNRRVIVNISYAMDSSYFHPPLIPPLPALNAMNDVCLNGLYSGQFLVAASGNFDENEARYPAAFDGRVVAVGGISPQSDALRWADKYFFDPSSFWGSTYGNWLDFTAPANLMIAPKIGPSVYWDFDECDYWTASWTSGTSLAVPAVAGIGGLLRSVEPRLLGEDLFEILARTARDVYVAGHDDSSGYGLPQARAALDYLDHSNKAFVQGRIGAFGTHGTLTIVDSMRVRRAFRHWPQLACTSCTESTTVYRLKGQAVFQAGFNTPPDTWARSSGTLGLLDSSIVDYQSVTYRGRVIPGTVTSVACSLETFVFRVDNLGWIPSPPESARIAFSCLGLSSLVGVERTPSVGASVRAYPNPARGVVRLRISGHPGGHARIEVFDVRGRRVRMLHDGPLEPGDHVLAWDSRDQRGSSVAPSVYFLRYDRAGRPVDRRVILIGRAGAGP